MQAPRTRARSFLVFAALVVCVAFQCGSPPPPASATFQKWCSDQAQFGSPDACWKLYLSTFRATASADDIAFAQKQLAGAASSALETGASNDAESKSNLQSSTFGNWIFSVDDSAVTVLNTSNQSGVNLKFSRNSSGWFWVATQQGQWQMRSDRSARRQPFAVVRPATKPAHSLDSTSTFGRWTFEVDGDSVHITHSSNSFAINLYRQSDGWISFIGGNTAYGNDTVYPYASLD
jgi:hypothetical protein